MRNDKPKDRCDTGFVVGQRVSVFIPGKTKFYYQARVVGFGYPGRNAHMVIVIKEGTVTKRNVPAVFITAL